jgi:hypothetical protein
MPYLLVWLSLNYLLAPLSIFLFAADKIPDTISLAVLRSLVGLGTQCNLSYLSNLSYLLVCLHLSYLLAPLSIFILQLTRSRT